MPRKNTSPSFLITLAVCAASFAPGGSALAEPGALKTFAAPVRCQHDEDLHIADRNIVTSGTAVEVLGNCDVTITDSRLVAGELGIHVNGNGTVFVERSFIQGASGALRIAGNGDLTYRDSTLRGGVRTLGNGELHNRGGNTVEVIPTAADNSFTPALPCPPGTTRQLIGGSMPATDLVVEAGCQLLVSDTELAGTLTVEPGGHLRLRNATVSGTIEVAAGGRAHAAGSHLEEVRAAPEGRFEDGGGNTLARRAARDLSRPTPERPTHRTVEGSVTGDLAQAAAVLGGLADSASEIAGRPSPAIPSGRLVGTWRVTGGAIAGNSIAARGEIVFDASGAGLQNYRIELGGQTIPQIGAFQWRDTGEVIEVRGEGVGLLEWRRLENRAHRQRVALLLDGGIEAELVLEREP